MMRFLLLFLLIAGFVIGLIVFAPLSFILKTTGAADRGLSWTSVDGTLAGGRITGLRAGQDLLGDASLKLNPASLLGLGIEYNFDWSGPSGEEEVAQGHSLRGQWSFATLISSLISQRSMALPRGSGSLGERLVLPEI